MKNYIELSEEEKLSYDNLLKTVEWDTLRKRLFSEADYKCSNCNKEASKDGKSSIYINQEFRKKLEDEGNTLSSFFYPTILHLHHTYYVRKTLPWDYPDSCYRVVCGDCHSKIHKEQIILMYPNFTFTQSENITPCDRCDGLGYLSHYYYVDNGVCFKCEGAGFKELMDSRQQGDSHQNIDAGSSKTPTSTIEDDNDLPFGSYPKDNDLDWDDLPF
jgi:hypothetical protein